MFYTIRRFLDIWSIATGRVTPKILGDEKASEIRGKATVELIVQIALTAIFVAIASYLLLNSLSTGKQQEIAMALFGFVGGYWLR